MEKIIYDFNGLLFDDDDKLNAYISKIVNRHGFDIKSAEASATFNEIKKDVVSHTEEWITQSYHGKIQEAIEPLLKTIDIIIHTSLDKTRLKELLKDLQIAINRINIGGFYGR